MRVAALICAKGNSTRVPSKNRRVIAGKPLIQWAIEIGTKAKYIDDVYVSTDCDLIKGIAEENGAIVIDRPWQLAQHNSGGGATQIHALKAIHDIRVNSNHKAKYDYMIDLWCTSPLVQSWQVDDAIEKFINQNAMLQLTSVTNIKATELQHIFIIDKRFHWMLSPTGLTDGLFSCISMLPMVKTNGAFGIYNPNVIDYDSLAPITEDSPFEWCDTVYFRAGERFAVDNNKMYGYAIDDISALDINTEDDILMAEYFLNKRYGGKS